MLENKGIISDIINHWDLIQHKFPNWLLSFKNFCLFLKVHYVGINDSRNFDYCKIIIRHILCFRITFRIDKVSI